MPSARFSARRVWGGVVSLLGVAVSTLALPACRDGGVRDGGEASAAAAPRAEAVAGARADREGAGSEADDATPDDAALAAQYEAAKARATADGAGAASLASARADLEQVANGARDPHLRANASLLLGSLAEAADDRKTAISYYRQAATLVPEEASAHAVLALALAAEGQLPAAIESQVRVVEAVPDDLQAWLILGELNVKAGREADARAAYAAYELRRKGIIDGLTLRNKDGSYLVDVEDRIGCASALAVAADPGTGVALIYALETEPHPEVRAEIVLAMGEHRFDIYRPSLEKARAAGAGEHPELAAALAWALAEIERDPVVAASEPGEAPAFDPAGSAADPELAAPGSLDEDAPAEPAPSEE